LKSTNPNFQFVVYLLDEFPVEFRHDEAVQQIISGNQSDFRIVCVQDLELDDWPRTSFQYTPFELACAMKPFATEHALKNFSTKVLYFDADIEIFDSLEDIVGELDSASILLTPHLTRVPVVKEVERKNLEDFGPSEIQTTIRQGGIYNAGFYAVANTPTTMQFLDWWKSRCRQHCYIDPPSGVFVDQGWLDLVPGLFEGVTIERRNRFNVAYWNIDDRNLRTANHLWVVDKNDVTKKDGNEFEKMCFFHFSGFDIDEPGKLTKFDFPIHSPVENVAKLLKSYSDNVKSFCPERYEELGCEFDAWPDGTSVNPYWREAIRADFSELQDVANPWDLDQTPDLIERLVALEPKAILQRPPWELAMMHRESARLHQAIQDVKNKMLKRRLKRFVSALSGFRSTDRKSA